MSAPLSLLRACIAAVLAVSAFAGTAVAAEVHRAITAQDLWDFKPPGIFFVHALGQALFGKHMFATRLLEAMALAAPAEVTGSYPVTFGYDGAFSATALL